MCPKIPGEFLTDKGHVVGMLDRDQRTARTPDKAAVAPSPPSSSASASIPPSSAPSPQSGAGFFGALSAGCWCRPRPQHQPRALPRLKEALVVTVCILAVARGAPIATTNTMERSTPIWVNPCGEAGHSSALNIGDSPTVSNMDLINQIITPAKLALSSANRFKDVFIENTFKTDYDQHHMRWKEIYYDWLPSLPKQLGERISLDHLQKTTLDETLVNIYQYLQQVAVGLEQVGWDMIDHEDPFLVEMKDAEYKLRSVLCEIHTAILERGLEPRPDVERSLMPDNYRQMKDAVYRNVRDWFIFRDYMNVLEYVIQTMEHFVLHASE